MSDYQNKMSEERKESFTPSPNKLGGENDHNQIEENVEDEEKVPSSKVKTGPSQLLLGASSSDREVWENGTMVDHFRIEDHIGKGGYGEIYSAIDTNTDLKYAMKVEPINQLKKGLQVEIDFSEQIGSSKYFPIIYWHGEALNALYLIMELLGPSLSNLRRQMKGRKFSKASATYLAYYSFVCIEDFHKRGYIHRDIKPGNFLLRPSWETPVCLIDFGLSKPYIDFRTGRLLPERNAPGFTGTCKYASLNAHEGREQGRRDDLISWFYGCYEFYNGRLPWPASRDKKLTMKKKQSISQESLLRKVPPFWANIYQHISSLSYESEPNYDLIKRILKAEVDKDEGPLDWEKLPQSVVDSISKVPLCESGNRKSAEAKTQEPSTSISHNKEDNIIPSESSDSINKVCDKNEAQPVEGGCTCRIV